MRSLNSAVQFRPAREADWPTIWNWFQQVTREGLAFAYDESTPEMVARKLWFEPPAVCWIAHENEIPLGTYYLRPNYPGRGSHVANAGYMVAPETQGRGLSRLLCEHSIAEAKRIGYRGMQFNFVVSTNAAAVKTWQRCGFQIVGRLPGAFHHARLGYVDALVFFRSLLDESIRPPAETA